MVNVLEKVSVALGIPITLKNFKKGLMHLKTRIIFFLFKFEFLSIIIYFCKFYYILITFITFIIYI